MLFSTHFQQDGREHRNALTVEAPVHTLCTKFLCNDARLYDVRLGAKATVFAGNSSTVVAVFDQQRLPFTHGSAFYTVAGLWLLSFVVSNEPAHFLSERVIFCPVR